jgi:hypothetical protein
VDVAVKEEPEGLQEVVAVQTHHLPLVLGRREKFLAVDLGLSEEFG